MFDTSVQANPVTFKDLDLDRLQYAGNLFFDIDANVKTIDNCEYSSSRDGELVHINCQVLHGDHAAILWGCTPPWVRHHG